MVGFKCMPWPEHYSQWKEWSEVSKSTWVTQVYSSCGQLWPCPLVLPFSPLEGEPLENCWLPSAPTVRWFWLRTMYENPKSSFEIYIYFCRYWMNYPEISHCNCDVCLENTENHDTYKFICIKCIFIFFSTGAWWSVRGAFTCQWS